jgi:hypothetical protein
MRNLLLILGPAALEACAPSPPAYTPPAYTPPVWTTPAWKAEETVRKQRSNELMKKWVGCETDKTRELALSDLPALVAVLQAIASCKEAREDWVQNEVGPGISRETLPRSAFPVYSPSDVEVFW